MRHRRRGPSNTELDQRIDRQRQEREDQLQREIDAMYVGVASTPPPAPPTEAELAARAARAAEQAAAEKARKLSRYLSC